MKVLERYNKVQSKTQSNISPIKKSERIIYIEARDYIERKHKPKFSNIHNDSSYFYSIEIIVQDNTLPPLGLGITKDFISEINSSKYIYTLKDNWDDEGSVGYNKATWNKTIAFLTKLISKTYIRKGITIQTPKIAHGPNGSIDIFWENEFYNLLVNIKSDSDIVSYYGEFHNEESLKGTFKIGSDTNALDIFLTSSINKNELSY